MPKTAKTSKIVTFGMHLLLDAYQADPKPLDDMKRVFQFLNTFPEIIDMHRLSAPHVLDCQATKAGKDPGGITGFVLIAESHISLHTFPKRGFFTLDIYSCKNFESQTKNALSYINQTFPHRSHDLKIIHRGPRYPSSNTA